MITVYRLCKLSVLRDPGSKTRPDIGFWIGFGFDVVIGIMVVFHWGQPNCDVRGKSGCKKTDWVPGDP